jgi:RNA polymerase sigma-70 factor (ECF subfamily)
VRPEVIPTAPGLQALSDEEVVRRVLAGECGLFELLMRRYNQRVYRVARSIVKDEAEAEDVMQEAYVRAYAHLAQYQGLAPFSTWLTKIAVYEAMARIRKRDRVVRLRTEEEGEELGFGSGPMGRVQMFSVL